MPTASARAGGRGDGAAGVGQVGDAEVAEHDLDARQIGVAAEHEVARLEVAVDDAAAVRGGERRQDLAVALDRAAQRARAALAQHVAQRAAGGELHDDAARGLVHVEHRDDVRVAQRRHHARLVEEAREGVGALGAGEVRVEQLDRDVAIELGVAREIDDAGRAAPELAHQPVARAGLHAGDVARGDRLAGDRRRAAGELAQPLDAHAHVRIVDVAAEHRLVVAQRALVIARAGARARRAGSGRAARTPPR